MPTAGRNQPQPDDEVPAVNADARRPVAMSSRSAHRWWTPAWTEGGDQDPDVERVTSIRIDDPRWDATTSPEAFSDEAILAPLEAQFGQVRSRERVRELAEVFTHQREVEAMLDLIPDAFAALDVKFLEPSAGSGNFVTEVLRRKLALVSRNECFSQEHFEHRLLRAVASIYGVDISPENVAEARGRMAHVLLEHYQHDANTIEPTPGFLNAAALILGDNIVVGDTLNAADQVELCDWRPYPDGCFRRVWSLALVPPADRNLFWEERVEDIEPVHYSQLVVDQTTKARRKGRVPR